MNEFKLYRITAPKVLDKNRNVPLDLTIKSNDRDLALKSACRCAGYTSVSDAAASAQMGYWELIDSMTITEIQDVGNVLPAPFNDKAVDQALLEISSATERMPDYVACAVRHWLALELVKRRHGKVADEIDTSWVPGLIKSFEDYLLIVSD